MDTALWIAQGLLAAAFLITGGMKLAQTKEQLQPKMAFVEDFPQGMLRLIGVLEVLGAVGLILPGVTGIAPVLVPLAATGLALDMLGATIVHIRRKEYALLPPVVVLGAMSAFVAWGRFTDWPL